MQLVTLTSRDQSNYRKTVFIPYVNPRKCSVRAIWRSVPHQCLREKEARTLKSSLHKQTTNKTDLKCSKLEEQQVPQHLASGTCHSEGMKHATLVKPARVQPSSRCLGKSVRTKQTETFFYHPTCSSKILYYPCWAFLPLECLLTFYSHMTLDHSWQPFLYVF